MKEDAGLRKQIHRTRCENLNKVIREMFKGNVSDAARKIGRSHTFMWQLAKGKRTIGEASARNIEEALEVGENTLDLKIERTKELHAFTGNSATSKQTSGMVPKLTLEELDDRPSSNHHISSEETTS